MKEYIEQSCGILMEIVPRLVDKIVMKLMILFKSMFSNCFGGRRIIRVYGVVMLLVFIIKASLAY